MPKNHYFQQFLAFWSPIACCRQTQPEPAGLPPKRSPVHHYLWAVLIARIYEVFPLLKCLSVQECSGVSSVQHAGVRQGKRRVQARVHGAQSAQNGCDADGMRQKSDRKAIDWPLRGLLKPSQVEFDRLACSQVKQKIKNDLQ